MSQGLKITVGVSAIIILILIISVLVWTTTTVNQLTKDKDRLDQATQKLADNSDKLADKVKTLENQTGNISGDLSKVRQDIDGIDTEIVELISATGRQLNDIKRVIVEQDVQLDNRISAVEQSNTENSEKLDELNRRLSPQKTSAAPTQTVKRPSGRIFVDVNNPNGPLGWEEQYTVQLRSIVADKQNFLIDWYKPSCSSDISPSKPDVVKKTPKFRSANQLYFFLKLGDAADNRIAGVIDFAPTDKKYFPFDLYLDKDRDGDLVEDKVPITGDDEYHIHGVKVPYKDGTVEEYSLQIYAVQDGDIDVWYGPEAGRYGVFEADKKRISVLVLDSSGNGLFNDSADDILMDWDLDGQIDADENIGLYSVFELPGGKYRVAGIDPAGRHITLTRMH